MMARGEYQNGWLPVRNLFVQQPIVVGIAMICAPAAPVLAAGIALITQSVMGGQAARDRRTSK